jgi:TnpA family transposase
MINGLVQVSKSDEAPPTDVLAQALQQQALRNTQNSPDSAISDDMVKILASLDSKTSSPSTLTPLVATAPSTREVMQALASLDEGNGTGEDEEDEQGKLEAEFKKALESENVL